ncbi:unnamed protein product, partial [Rotaria sordida]
ADGRACHRFLLASTGQCRFVLIEIDVGDSKNENLIQSQDNYLYNHRNYYLLLNNCRTFFEYLIDEIVQYHN